VSHALCVCALWAFIQLIYTSGSAIPQTLFFNEMSELNERVITRLLVRSEHTNQTDKKGILRIEMQDCSIAGTFRTLTISVRSTTHEILHALMLKIQKERGYASDNHGPHRMTLLEFAEHWFFYSNSTTSPSSSLSSSSSSSPSSPLSSTSESSHSELSVAAPKLSSRSADSATNGPSFLLANSSSTASSVTTPRLRKRPSKGQLLHEAEREQQLARWLMVGDTVWDGALEPELVFRKPANQREHAAIARNLEQYLEQNAKQPNALDISLKAYAFSHPRLELIEQRRQADAALALFSCLQAQHENIVANAKSIMQSMPDAKRALAEPVLQAFESLIREVEVEAPKQQRRSSNMGMRLVNRFTRRKPSLPATVL
jgi:hypothetical protein